MAELSKSAMMVIVAKDRIPEDHPLFLCDQDSPQFLSTLKEYFEARQANNHSHYLLKGVTISSKKIT